MLQRRRSCCQGGCPVKFCPKLLCPIGGGTALLVGATVTVGGSLSCIADATGCCTINGLTAGPHAVTVTMGGATFYSNSSLSLACNGTSNLLATSMPSTYAALCCGTVSGPSPIPRALHITDANGTYPFAYVVGSNPPQWSYCYMFTPPYQVVTAGGVGQAPFTNITLGTASLAISYVGNCTSDGQFQLFVSSEEVWVGPIGTGGALQNCGSYNAGAGGWQASPCNSKAVTGYYDSTLNCSSGLTGYFMKAPWTSVSPFAWSINFPATPSNIPSIVPGATQLPHPSAGTIAISS